MSSTPPSSAPPSSAPPSSAGDAPLPRPRTPPPPSTKPPPDARGTLFRYGPAAANVAFQYETETAHGRHVVFVGGLTDGFFAVPFLPPLAAALDAAGWTLVHALLRSSHTAWGYSDLDADAADLATLLAVLGRRGSAGVVVVGHSTGCQDAVRLALRLREAGDAGDAAAAADRAPLLGVVLQAPVSDREWLAHDPHTPRRVAAAASAVCADMERSIIFWSDWDGAPVTATRTLALAAKGGDDDAFSSDLTDSELRRAMAPLAGTPTLVLASGADEYVPRAVDIGGLAHRIAGAVVPRGTGEAVVVEGAPHSGAGHEGAVVAAIVDFVGRRCQP